jgi:hypothetical protein
MITETREWIVKYKSPSAGTAKVPLDKTVAFYKEHLARDYYLEKVRDGRLPKIFVRITTVELVECP